MDLEKPSSLNRSAVSVFGGFFSALVHTSSREDGKKEEAVLKSDRLKSLSSTYVPTPSSFFSVRERKKIYFRLNEGNLHLPSRYSQTVQL
jgi:hypothetical protein